MLTQFRLLAIAGATLTVAFGGQALAFWPFGGTTHIALSPAYGGVCEDCDLSGRILAGARLERGEFRRVSFRSAIMTRVAGADADYEDSDFTDAILDDAEFQRARFGRSRMSRVRMMRTNFSDADLSRVVDLTQSQLAEACGNARTRLPRGLTIADCTHDAP